MIIAEIGLNHLGVVSSAYAYIDALAETKVDAITFQVREKDFYKESCNKHFIFEEKSYDSFSKYVKSKGKLFGIALGDESIIDYFESIDTDFYKVIRSDMLNDELMSGLLSTGKKVYVSTGQASIDQIDECMHKYSKYDNLILNHTQLSPNVEDANLSAIKTLRDIFKARVSYGSHCINPNVLYMSLCYEPESVLFYVKACDLMRYPDSLHAVRLDEVRELCENIIRLKSSVGDGKK